MKKKRRLRRCVYDLIINLCLLGALICLIIGSNTCLKNFNNRNIVDVAKQIFLEKTNIEDEKKFDNIEETESETLSSVNKLIIINNYLDSIKDRIITEDLIPYNEIITWNSYEILDIKYIKQIALDYYKYQVDIKLNQDAITSIPKNETLSTDNQLIISLNFYILNQNNDYIVKMIEYI